METGNVSRNHQNEQRVKNSQTPPMSYENQENSAPRCRLQLFPKKMYTRSLT